MTESQLEFEVNTQNKSRYEQFYPNIKYRKGVRQVAEDSQL